MLFKEMAEELRKGRVKKLQALTQQALDEGVAPNDIINEALMKGMKTVGELFQSGDMFVPEVLMASRAMNASMEMVKPLLAGAETNAKGVCVFATVKGDLHDIGKKLVCMMLESSGYSIVDLGVDVSAEDIVKAAKENNADIVGMSAMLTTTMMEMKNVVDQLQANDVAAKVMVGGAPISDTFADQIGANYSHDAAEAVVVADRLMGY